MLNQPLKDFVVDRLLPQVQTPGQYIGGEWNAVRKDRRTGCQPVQIGKLCLAFPDTYSIGMSHHGLQVLYDVMNRRDDWACQRAFTPLGDMEQLLREHHVPLYGLESFTPLHAFDVLGFTLQYDLCYSNVLAMLDLGGIPLRAEDRTMEHPLVIAGGPCAVNPEPMARFIDLFVIGDGEEALPEVCDLWRQLKRSSRDRDSMLAEMAARLPYAYVPRFYRRTGCQPVPTIQPAVVADLDAIPLPARPVVPYVECVQDRICIEIMRGCPGKCRFCQSTTIKRPLRFRKVETIVQAALEQYRNTGYNEISLLSLSTSDYPEFDELHAAAARDVPPAGRGRLAAQPADQRATAASGRSAEHRPPLGPHLGAGGRPRRHAPPDRQTDHQRGPLRRLPPGAGKRLFAGGLRRQGEARVAVGVQQIAHLPQLLVDPQAGQRDGHAQRAERLLQPPHQLVELGIIAGGKRQAARFRCSPCCGIVPARPGRSFRPCGTGAAA